MSSDVSWHIRDKLWPMPKHGSISLYVHGKPEGSLGRTAQDVHLDSHTVPELWTLQQVRLLLKCRLLPTTEPHTTAPYFPPVTKSYATVGFLCVVNYNRAPVQECVAGYTHHRVIPALECGVRIKIFIHCRIKIKYSLIVDKDICCLLGGGETKQQKTQKKRGSRRQKVECLFAVVILHWSWT